MSEAAVSRQSSAGGLQIAGTGSLVLVPAVITLAVTLLRLAGERLHWSRTLFNPSAGGGFALVGISWLVPLVGIYFGIVLARAGLGPRRPLRTTVLLFLSVAVLPLAGFLAISLGINEQSRLILPVWAVASLAAVLLAWRAWPTLGRTLLAYAFAARIPVAIVMLFAILGSWGTHYDVAPPNFPEMNPLPKWLLIGLFPQMTVWIAYTLTLGGVFGTVAGALTKPRP